MALKKINETLNELLLKVAGGVDYVTSIAMETGKSIPVVHRQLDSLVKQGLLMRTRAGKRVTYSLNWDAIGTFTAEYVLIDIHNLLKTTTNDLLKVFEGHTDEDFTELIKGAFRKEEVQELFSEFLRRAEQVQNIPEYEGATLAQVTDLFLDALGSVPQAEQGRAAKRLGGGEEIRALLSLSAARRSERAKNDPRAWLVAELVKS